jgi:hypothetical protein
VTYLAPNANGHSGSFGMQSEVQFSCLADARSWVLGNIPQHQHGTVKVWRNDLQFTGAARDALFLRAAESHSVWVKPKNGNGDWQVAQHDVPANCYHVVGSPSAYVVSELDIGPFTDGPTLIG